jgi:hypothetical protein
MALFKTGQKTIAPKKSYHYEACCATYYIDCHTGTSPGAWPKFNFPEYATGEN